ncbi:MAG: RsmE family RNA methyltransferase, partial [Methylocystaceae bacterium]
ERWQRIAEEACKQCGRDMVPRISQVHNFGQLLSGWQNQSVGFFYEAANTDGDNGLKKRLAEIKAQDPADLLLVVGPEGGFSRTEAMKAMEAGWQTCSLGPRILRTETAALTALSIIMYELGDLG